MRVEVLAVARQIIQLSLVAARGARGAHRARFGGRGGNRVKEGGSCVVA